MDTTNNAASKARWRGRQFHNQPEASHTHGFLVDLWNAVSAETGARVDIKVCAQNAGIPGSDPGALKMLIAGELEFDILMGGILGHVVPAAEIQGLPFAFASHAQVHRIMDGALGDYLRREMAAKGIYGLPFGCLENGFRHIVSRAKPVRNAADLAGYRMRIPNGKIFRELFTALGAEPVVANIDELYTALESGRVDGQENPLVVCEFNKLYQVARYVTLTNHMWSGFNLVANLGFWQSLPEDVRQIIERNVKIHVARQRAYTDNANHELETTLAQRGMVFNHADVASFRARLAGGFYTRWKKEFGPTAWDLLEAEVGRLG
jgi:tripartite ATP-independent transporter DctP family solute receptor